MKKESTKKGVEDSANESSNISGSESDNSSSSTPAKPIDNATRAAARGTLFTLVLRLISFICTQLTIRALDPSTLGTNIQLELLLTTVLFISREGFRLALTQNVVPENWTVGSFGVTIQIACVLCVIILILLPILSVIGSLVDHSSGHSRFGINLDLPFDIRNIR